MAAQLRAATRGDVDAASTRCNAWARAFAHTHTRVASERDPAHTQTYRAHSSTVMHTLVQTLTRTISHTLAHTLARICTHLTHAPAALVTLRSHTAIMHTVPHSHTRTASPGVLAPHLHRDWAHACHICTGTGLTPGHICTETGLTPGHICTGTGLTA